MIDKTGNDAGRDVPGAADHGAGIVKRIGITGGIGSGKSTVCRLFSRLGVPVYCSDMRAHEIMNGWRNPYAARVGDTPDGDIRRAIVTLLGPEAYRSDGVLDSAFIASKIFTDKILQASLNAIVHPAVALDFESWALSFADLPYLLLESAILFESGFDRLVDRVVTVSAPESMRLERVMARGHGGGTSREEVMRRMATQLTDAEREARADFCIDNSGSLEYLAAQVQLLDQQLKI